MSTQIQMLNVGTKMAGECEIAEMIISVIKIKIDNIEISVLLLAEIATGTSLK
ncbi:hypothetical protein GCM10010995_23150 [Cysteiniphilum litorale]|uniref:Uncharacterized protein n=1 Tax=Cysteiniphilum litorale TaxID=2056700 RepID=A0A8J2Z676_9GAMM|nr:hypothetical protein GCM10010995_23150 [Cysteiniphilum litorale]